MKTKSESIKALKPHPRNYRIHPEEQLKHIQASIEANGFYRPVVVSSDDYILAGHGVVEASTAMGLEKVPVVRLAIPHDSPKALKVLTGDNEIARLGEFNEEALTKILQDVMESGEDLEGTGFQSLESLLEELGEGEGSTGSGEETPYTAKIETPIYEPKGEKPTVGELYDEKKRIELKDKILAADITEAERAFLLEAASRHTVFRFDRIADYYAHAEPNVQRLMEDSALVIVDINSAIESGFVRLTENLRDMYVRQKEEDEDAA